jgi:hypothetical protein
MRAICGARYREVKLVGAWIELDQKSLTRRPGRTPTRCIFLTDAMEDQRDPCARRGG